MVTADKAVTARWRDGLVAVALVLGCLLTTASVVAGLANRELLDAGRFARTVDQVRVDPTVAAALGHQLVVQVLAQNPDLVALRPALEQAAAALVASKRFSPVVQEATRQLHTSLVRPGDGPVVLRLVDVASVAVPVLRTVAPGLTLQRPAELDLTVARGRIQELSTRLVHGAHLLRTASWLLPLLALLSFAVAIAAAGDRRATASSCGLAVAAGGLLTGLLTAVVTAMVPSGPELSAVLARAAWHALADGVWTTVTIVTVSGLLIAAGIGGRLGRWVRGARRVRRRLASKVHRDSRWWPVVPVGLVGLGISLLLWPLGTVQTLVVLLGVALVLAGVGELALLAPQSSQGEARGPTPAGRSGRRALLTAMVAVGVVAVVGVAAADVQPGLLGSPTAPEAASTETCNGSAALCDRPYDQVSFPATHNSMAAADEPGWFFAEQPTGVLGQLDAGIRVFLIDAWPGQQTQRAGVIATAGPSKQSALAQAREAFGPAAVDSALRLRDSSGLQPTGPVEPYLCHGSCELGATKWEPLMVQVREWLAVHPREVVTFFVQDEGVTPAQTDEVFADAGLLPLVHTQRPGEPWPTLGQLIDTDQRVVVLMENQGGGTAYPWQLQGFDWVQDTPFDARSVRDFSCEPNRGPAAAPIFLVNHWINTHTNRVTASRTANAYDVLLPRARQCQAERGRLPTYLAVDFFNEGALFRVVDELNGLR